MDILSQMITAEGILRNDPKRRIEALPLYYETAIHSKDKYAPYRLGKCYDMEIGVKHDYEEAVKQYTISAETGYAEAQFALGCCLYNKMSFDSSSTSASQEILFQNVIRWCEKAVAQGHIEAKSWLADVLEERAREMGDKESGYRAFQLSLERANEGEPSYQRFVGQCYREGNEALGVEKSDEKALFWYKKAAEQNDPEAWNELADIYLKGCGVKKSEEKAKECYLKRVVLYEVKAINGDSRAAREVAQMYREGKGVEENFEKAEAWEKKAEELAELEKLKHIPGDIYGEEFYEELLRDLTLAIRTCLDELPRGTIVGDGSTIDMIAVANAADKINACCIDMDIVKKDIQYEYQEEEKAIAQSSAELIADMKSKHEEYRKTLFAEVRKEIEDLVALLRKDYDDEWRVLSVSEEEFKSASYEENEGKLRTLVESINECVRELNAVDFDVLVPAVKVEVNGDKFITYTTNRSEAQKFDHRTPGRSEIRDPKPLKEIVGRLYPYCKKALACLDAMVAICDRSFNIEGFNAFVKSSATAWLSEKEAKLRGKYAKLFDELFGEKAIASSFFTDLEAQGAASDVDPTVGASTYNEALTIGDVKLSVTSSAKHLEYFKESPTLNKYLKNGCMLAPLVMNLRKCGNVLLNVDEENYSDETMDFVNQLILRFMLSFPANRINLCLIDIDNKMEFSRFKSLTKINNNILFNGIIRDDRQLENTIKDMEQVMYKIDDDILSYNDVEDIYEYNQRFEANPQSVHLFVLVNYPSGMREDTAKKVLKLVQNGNKAGIFSIIINNEDCPLTPGYKLEEFDKFIEGVSKSALVIDKKENEFHLDLGVPCTFAPRNNVTVSMLPSIVEMLKESAESSKQKVVPLAQMFADSDTLAASPKGIPSSAEVLDIPIGARGGETQNLLLKTSGDGSAHAVVIGGTGSGKSNLLHAIIMSACYKYSPEELNLYLIDFKGGVEFKFYEAGKVKEKQIPHIKLTGLTSDLEDGVAILNNLQKELRRREDMFRQCGVEDIVQYRNLGKVLPRLFVIIDEIQELFEQDDRLGQKAIDILRELFKKGRAFGINILWASQNIPKAPGLKDKVLSQIGNRISLRLNEPDDALDIKIDPKVVRNLNRPEKGLGVINDIRYGNDSMEFRVAYAESSEKRQK